jgi:hypothetical protein
VPSMLSSCEAAYRSVRLCTPAVSLDDPHPSIWPAAYSGCWAWAGECHPLLKSSPIKGEEGKAKFGRVFPLPGWEGTKVRVGSSPLACPHERAEALTTNLCPEATIPEHAE